MRRVLGERRGQGGDDEHAHGAGSHSGRATRVRHFLRPPLSVASLPRGVQPPPPAPALVASGRLSSLPMPRSGRARGRAVPLAPVTPAAEEELAPARLGRAERVPQRVQPPSGAPDYAGDRGRCTRSVYGCAALASPAEGSELLLRALLLCAWENNPGEVHSRSTSCRSPPAPLEQPQPRLLVPSSPMGAIADGTTTMKIRNKPSTPDQIRALPGDHPHSRAHQS
jgi:hypothetical protein